jgi:thioesterase domain-containing protein
MGRSGGAVADQAFMSAVRRVSVAFDRAITQYRPQPYDGPVLMLSSQRRAYSGDVAGLRKMFSGHTDRYVVGTTHAHALDPHNPAFASALQECLGRIRQTAVQGAGHGATTSRAINA